MTIKVSSKNFKDLFIYTFVQYFGQALNIFRGFIIARLLGPYLLGMINSLSLVQQYGSNSNFGLQQGMTKLLPTLKGENEFVIYNKIKNQSVSLTIILTLFISFVGILCTWIFYSKLDLIYKIGATFYFIEMPLYQFFIFNDALARVNLNFRIVSLALFSYQATYFLSSIALVYFFNIWGAFISILVKYSFTYAIYKKNCESFIFTFNFDKFILINLFKNGFLLTLIGFLYSFVFSFDRLYIIKYLTPERLGFYSIATTFAILISNISDSICSYIYPRIMMLSRRDSSNIEVKVISYKIISITTVIIAPLIGFVAIFVKPLIIFILPQFKSSILPSIILLFGSFFSLFGSIVNSYYISKNKESKILLSSLISGILFITTLYAFNNSIRELFKVAVLVLLIKIAHASTILSWFLIDYHKKNISLVLFDYIKLYFPILYVSSILCLSYLLLPAHLIKIPFNLAIAQMFIMLVLYFPILYLKKNNIIIH